MDKAQQDALKKAAGIEAAKLVENGMIAGLGTGSTVKFLSTSSAPSMVTSMWSTSSMSTILMP